MGSGADTALMRGTVPYAEGARPDLLCACCRELGVPGEDTSVPSLWVDREAGMVGGGGSGTLVVSRFRGGWDRWASGWG